MVYSRRLFFASLAFFAVIASVVTAPVLAVAGYIREVISVAFPGADPRAAIRFRFTPSRVIGLPSLRAFRDRLLAREGDSGLGYRPQAMPA